MLKPAMIYKKILLPFFLIFLLATLVIAAIRITPFQQFSFSNEDELKAWEEKILKGRVFYGIEEVEGQAFLHAKSQSACSAIYKRVQFSPIDYPILSWKWRVVEFPAKAPALAEADDFPARLYVIFPGISFGTSRFLEYTWDEFIPKGRILNGPASNIKVVVVESGDSAQKNSDGWVVEKRSIIKDYIKAFRKRPRQRVGAIALMCDADTTNSSAESYFDEIVIDYKSR